MRLQDLRSETHAPTFPLSCASSERDHCEILKNTAKGVVRKISMGVGQWEKQDRK